MHDQEGKENMQKKEASSGRWLTIPDPVREKDSRLFQFLRGVATIVLHTFLPVTYHHEERLQKEPPFVMISNHRHALDPVIMAYPVRQTQTVFLGKKELGKGSLASWFLATMHCILVDRHHTDMEAMRACMRAMKMKKVLVIFPEGTRHHEGQMEQIENGASFIIMRSRVPVMPVYIDSKLRLFRRTHVYVGEAIPYEDLLSEGVNAETCEKMNERMRETFRALIREAEKNKKNFSEMQDFSGKGRK